LNSVAYESPWTVAVSDVPDPRLERPGDAVVAITSAGHAYCQNCSETRRSAA